MISTEAKAAITEHLAASDGVSQLCCRLRHPLVVDGEGGEMGEAFGVVADALERMFNVAATPGRGLGRAAERIRSFS